MNTTLDIILSLFFLFLVDKDRVKCIVQINGKIQIHIEKDKIIVKSLDVRIYEQEKECIIENISHSLYLNTVVVYPPVFFFPE